MSIEIDVLNGDASWPMAEPLFDAVWPPDVGRKAALGRHRLCPCRICGCWCEAEPDGVVCHVGIYRREVTWNGRKMRAGGIGGVATREDCRRRGYASIALDAAIQTLKDEGATDFALLFCEPHNVAVLRRRAAGSRSTARSMPSSRRAAFASTASRPMSTTSSARR